MKPISLRSSTSPRVATPRQAFVFLAISAWLVAGLAPSTLLAKVKAKAAAQAPATLSFNIAARVEAKGGSEKNIVRTTTGRVFLRGQQARIETKLGDQTIVMLLLKPYVYRLLPSSKAGVRYKSSTPSPELAAFFSDWPGLMNQPSRIRAALSQKGAKKTGAAKLGGVATDVYSATRWAGQARPVKIWLRRSDSLPLRLESSAAGAKVTLNWSNYQRVASLSSSLFAVPKCFKIREGRAPAAIG